MDTNETLRDSLAETLLDIVKNGIVLTDKAGFPVLDENGKPMRVPATAAHLSVARAYVRDNPPVSVPTSHSTSALLKEQMEKINLPFGNVTPLKKSG